MRLSNIPFSLARWGELLCVPSPQPSPTDQFPQPLREGIKGRVSHSDKSSLPPASHGSCHALHYSSFPRRREPTEDLSMAMKDIDSRFRGSDGNWGGYVFRHCGGGRNPGWSIAGFQEGSDIMGAQKRPYLDRPFVLREIEGERAGGLQLPPARPTSGVSWIAASAAMTVGGLGYSRPFRRPALVGHVFRRCGEGRNPGRSIAGFQEGSDIMGAQKRPYLDRPFVLREIEGERAGGLQLPPACPTSRVSWIAASAAMTGGCPPHPSPLPPGERGYFHSPLPQGRGLGGG